MSMPKLRNLSERENELYQRVDEVLHYLWDPIGVSDIPEARDEYYSYAPQIFSLLMQSMDVAAITSHLANLATVSIGMEPQTERDMEVAEILIHWREVLMDD